LIHTPNLLNLFFFFLSFLCILIFRLKFINRAIYAVLYHAFLGLLLVVLCVGGGGVLNEDYDRLEEFRRLEKNNQLANAKKHPQDYKGLRFDLEQFEDSRAFKKYIQENERRVDRTVIVFFGWLLAFFAELPIGIIRIIRKKRGPHP